MFPRFKGSNSNLGHAVRANTSPAANRPALNDISNIAPTTDRDFEKMILSLLRSFKESTDEMSGKVNGLVTRVDSMEKQIEKLTAHMQAAAM